MIILYICQNITHFAIETVTTPVQTTLKLKMRRPTEARRSPGQCGDCKRGQEERERILNKATPDYTFTVPLHLSDSRRALPGP